MNIDFITRDDLESFRQQLLTDFRNIVNSQTPEKKEWLRCSDVRKMLKVSGSTLQNLRINGKLKFKKIGGIYFYRLSDIEAMLEGGQ